MKNLDRIVFFIKFVLSKLKKIMKKLIITLLIVLSSISSYGQQSEHGYHFYMHDENTITHSELYRTLFTEVDNRSDLFKWCCDCISFYARICGLSYYEMNLIIFVIIQPLIAIVLFIMVVRLKIKLRRMGRPKIHLYQT